MKKQRVFLILVYLVALSAVFLLILAVINHRNLPTGKIANDTSKDVHDLEYWHEKVSLITLESEKDLQKLHRAAGKGDLDAAKLLLDKGEDVNSRDKDGWTPLHWAAFEGKTEMVKFLLNSGAMVNAKAYDISDSGLRFQFHSPAQGTPEQWRSAHKREHETPLKAALASGRLDTPQLLINRGAELGNPDQLLLWAVEQGYAGGVEVLLNNGAHVDAREERGWMPIHWATARGHPNVIRVLLSQGANPNARTTAVKYEAGRMRETSTAGQTPLHVISGSDSGMEVLIKKGADINAQDEKGNTPLFEVIDFMVENSTRALLSRGANVNIRNKLGETVLHTVIAYRDADKIRLLLDHGANPNIADRNGRTPLHLVAEYGTVEQAKLMVSKGANIFAKKKTGETPFDVAVKHNKREVAVFLNTQMNVKSEKVRISSSGLNEAISRSDMNLVASLLAKRVKINAPDENGLTPLHRAVAIGNLEIVKLLLGKRADVNATDIFGWTPLHKAAQDGQLEITELLLATGAKVNAKAKDSDMPLHLAIEKRHYEVAKLLLRKGANPNAANRDGMMPMELMDYFTMNEGSETEDFEMVEILEKYGGKRSYY